MEGGPWVVSRLLSAIYKSLYKSLEINAVFLIYKESNMLLAIGVGNPADTTTTQSNTTSYEQNQHYILVHPSFRFGT